MIAIKAKRSNGLVYNDESMCLLSNELYMSVNTLKKYISKLKHLKVLVAYGEHHQFISFYKACELLKITIDKRIKCFKFCTLNKICVKTVVEQYHQETVMLNFKRQQFRIKKKQQEFDLINKVENSKHTHKKALKSLIKKYGSIYNAKQCVSKNFNNQIVTGKNHTSKLLNTSTANAALILKRMENKQFFKRTINTENVYCDVNQGSYEALKKHYKTQIVVPCKGFYKIVFGSVIKLNKEALVSM